MIAPRQPDTYEKFQELIAENFTVYTRLGYLVYAQTQIENTKIFSNHITTGLSTRDAKSEMLLISRWLGNATKSAQQLFDKVYNYVSLHRGTFEFILHVGKIIGDFYKLVGYDLRNTDTVAHVHGDWARFFKKKEEAYLLEHLNHCHMSAVVIPEHLCSLYAKKLVRVGHRHVFIGKETYTKMFYGFRVSGYGPPSISLRIRQIEIAGLWDLWAKFISRDIQLVNSWVPSTLVKPSMSGNVVVIFVSLLFGYGLGTIYFICEFEKFRLYSLNCLRFNRIKGKNE